jgi:hypothetical protein
MKMSNYSPMFITLCCVSVYEDVSFAQQLSVKASWSAIQPTTVNQPVLTFIILIQFDYVI